MGHPVRAEFIINELQARCIDYYPMREADTFDNTGAETFNIFLSRCFVKGSLEARSLWQSRTNTSHDSDDKIEASLSIDAGYIILCRSQEKINHLLYMDDIKLFAKNEKELESLIHAVRIYS